MGTRTSRRPPPRQLQGLELHTVEVGGERLAVLSYPLQAMKPRVELTRAERAIVRGLLRGESNAQIARARRTSPRTVANQVAGVFKKLGVSSRRELTARLHAQR